MGGHDSLHSLTAFDRGDLNESKDAITGTPAREQARQPAAGKPGRSCTCGALEVIGNWNVVAITGSDATVVEKLKYDPYGQFTLTVQEGQSASGNPYLFQGRRWDSEVALYYFRNRVYSPVLGRFLQRDPLGDGMWMSLYAYCDDRLSYYNDPYGLFLGIRPLHWGKAALRQGLTVGVKAGKIAGTGLELGGRGLGAVGDISGNIPVVGGVSQRLINVPADVLRGGGAGLQGRWQEAGRGFRSAGQNLVGAGGAALNSLWQAPQNVVGLGYGSINGLLSGFGLWLNFKVRHYQVTCSVPGKGKVAQDVWVIEGPIPQWTGWGASLGEVIHVGGKGESRLPATPHLRHEFWHSLAQSKVMGWGYLPGILGSYAVEGYWESYFEQEARQAADQGKCTVEEK